MISRLWRGVLDRPVLADALLGLGILAVLLTPVLLRAPEVVAERRTQTMVWILLGVVPVALRRSHPAWAIGTTAGYTYLPLLAPSSWHLIDTGVPLLVVTYTVAASEPLRRALGYLGILWTPIAGLETFRAMQPDSETSVPYVLIVDLVVYTGLLLAGRVMWNRHAYAAALRERALAAEANQRALAEKAVEEERRRIARELHDVVAHHISVMGILASGARRTLARDPQATDEALATIEQTGRSVLREMRRLLNLLRSDDTDCGPNSSPQPGLDAIDDLVAQFREAGLAVTCVVEGQIDGVDPGIAVTAYRLVQEALTNTLKHANAPSAEVRVLLGELVLTLEISDTGRGPSPDSVRSGFGLIGMRERVAFYGGSLRVGPRPGGGFRVRATIPLEAK